MEFRFSHSTKKDGGVTSYVFEFIIDEDKSIYFSTLNGGYIKTEFYNSVSDMAHLCLELNLRKEFIEKEIYKETQRINKLAKEIRKKEVEK